MRNFFILLLFSSFVMGDDLSWNAPVTLSSIVASDPQIIMDSNGNVAAAWVENGVVKANYKSVSGNWGSATTLGSSNSSSPRLGVDSDGNITAAWIQNGLVKVATRSSGGSWGSATTISSSSATSLVFSVNGDAQMVAAWVRSGLVEFSSNSGLLGSWSLALPISGASSTNPDISIGEDGTVCTVWHRTLNGKEVIQAVTKPFTGVLGSVQTITPSSTFSYGYPQTAVDSNGNASVVFYQYLVANASYTEVGLCTSSLISGNWSSPLLLASDPNRLGIINPANLTARLQYDSYGNAMALWSQSYDGSQFSLESALQPIGGFVWAIGDLLTATNVSYQADMAMTSLNEAVVAYMSLDGNNLAIKSSETTTTPLHNGSPTWTPATLVSAVMTNDAYPRISSVYTGGTLYAAAIWLTSNGSNIYVAAATGSKMPISPPSGLSVVQASHDFGILTQYYNTLSWTPSASPNVEQYAIYRNGILFDLVNASTTQIIDSNVPQGGAVTYGVAAISPYYLQGDIVNVNYP